MSSDMRKWCCDPEGRPDFNKMTAFMVRHDRTTRYDAAGWALFFIWVGVAWLADLGMGIGLLGVAAITLGMQGIRKLNGLAVEGFWILVGLGFGIAGLWQWIDVEKPLTPFVLIIIGVALFFWRVFPRRSARG